MRSQREGMRKAIDAPSRGSRVAWMRWKLRVMVFQIRGWGDPVTRRRVFETSGLYAYIELWWSWTRLPQPVKHIQVLGCSAIKRL